MFFRHLYKQSFQGLLYNDVLRNYSGGWYLLSINKGFPSYLSMKGCFYFMERLLRWSRVRVSQTGSFFFFLRMRAIPESILFVSVWVVNLLGKAVRATTDGWVKHKSISSQIWGCIFHNEEGLPLTFRRNYPDCRSGNIMYTFSMGKWSEWWCWATFLLLFPFPAAQRARETTKMI